MGRKKADAKQNAAEAVLKKLRDGGIGHSSLSLLTDHIPLSSSKSKATTPDTVAVLASNAVTIG